LRTELHGCGRVGGSPTPPESTPPPLQQHTDKQISLKQLLNKAGTLTISPDEASTLAARLARLNQQITPDERTELEQLAGQPLTEIIFSVSSCADPDTLQQARLSATKPYGTWSPRRSNRWPPTRSCVTDC
jgi:type I restriction enzyme R subunit